MEEETSQMYKNLTSPVGQWDQAYRINNIFKSFANNLFNHLDYLVFYEATRSYHHILGRLR